jgi:pyruvate/2-oxoglutarate dehydrogenase complex dihydrolipoamide dehydrogenase (E3) component
MDHQVWAMGECACKPNFTHVVTGDFRFVRDNLNGGKRTTPGSLVPFCIFTDPELARVGLSELEAQKLSGSVVTLNHLLAFTYGQRGYRCMPAMHAC